MIKEAEVLEPTGVMYVQENPQNALSAALARSINVYNPAFSHRGTGEETHIASQEQPEISPSLWPYHFLSMTTGCELPSIDIVVVVEEISERMTTDFHIAFECKNWTRARSVVRPREPRWFSNTNSASVQAERLREISGLKVERLAEIFGVSRTTYYKWLSGFPLHDVHWEHLLEVLPLVEEAAQRFGSPGATNTWLLTPVSPGGKKPIDYLTAQQYNTFRGFLLRAQAGREVFRPLAPSRLVYRERSREDIEDELERLNPGLRLDEDNADTSDINE